jgi:hypothetical protein
MEPTITFGVIRTTSSSSHDSQFVRLFQLGLGPELLADPKALTTVLKSLRAEVRTP